MTETPDFDQIALDIGVRAGAHPHPELLPDIAEQLRLVWNARGAADLATLDAEYDPDSNTLEDLIRSLDR